MTRLLRPNLVLLALLGVAGCSQILGLGDYDIDPSLGPDAAGGESGTSSGGSHTSGGKLGMNGGETSHAGEPGNAGEPGVGGEPATGGGSSGEGGAPSINCDTAKCCTDAGGKIVGMELLPPGDFETLRTAWGMSSGAGDILTRVTVDTIDANSGVWFAWLGGAVDDIGVLLSPSFSFPAGTGWLTFEGYRFFAFDTLTGLGDYASIALYAENEYDVPEETLFEWDNFEFDTDTWVAFSKEIPLGSYASTLHQISFIGVTDAVADDPDPVTGQAASNFFFDDVSFKAYRCE